MKIALCGLPRTGKDEIGKILTNHYRFIRLAFGDPLREMFHRDFPHIPREPKPRRHYQTYGKAMCAINEDVFNEKVEKTMNTMENIFEYTNFVVTDLRLPWDEAWCRRMGYKIVRVVSDKHIERAKSLGEDVDPSVMNAPSEQAVNDIVEDYVLYNNGTLEELELAVDDMLGYFTKMELREF